ncbi:MAG: hypothetical protein V7606_2138 [Burkholderiales bacterium]|jgi:hypothetical protein
MKAFLVALTLAAPMLALAAGTESTPQTNARIRIS